MTNELEQIEYDYELREVDSSRTLNSNQIAAMGHVDLHSGMYLLQSEDQEVEVYLDVEHVTASHWEDVPQGPFNVTRNVTVFTVDVIESGNRVSVEDELECYIEDVYYDGTWVSEL